MTKLSRNSRHVAGFGTVIILVACVVLPGTTALGQIYYPYGYQHPHAHHYGHHYGNYYGAVDALASRVYAQAEFLRATGEASVNYATAREIRARAFRLEIANSIERIKAIWEVRAIGEAELFKRRYNHLDSKRRRNNKTWDRLKNHPDLNGPAIANGRALNFLLHRLSATVLAYEYSRDYSNSGDAVAQQLALPPDILNGLRLRQRLSNGKSLVFTADDPSPLRVDWWPFALRDEQFAPLRSDFEKQRQQVVKEAHAGKVSVQTLKGLTMAFAGLNDGFRKKYNKERRHRGGFETWKQYQQADVFLKSLWGEIGRVQSVGDISFLDGDLRFDRERDGGNLVALLRFMSRNGLDFAPAKQGNENSYHFAFTMMRDLYINVADDDEALQPQTEKYQR